jgi:hypothetical protein
MLIAPVLAGLVFGLASTASATTLDKRTYFTFSQPVALPGVTLPAGTYMFRLADPVTTRKVIQVTNEAGTMSYALLNTMTASRPEPAGEPEVRFIETPAGSPAPVSAWWYPGDRLGYQFIYSEAELEALRRGAATAASDAADIAADAGEPVAVPADTEVARADSAAEALPEPAAAPRAEPVAEPVAEALPELAAAPQQPVDVSGDTREQLPQTASPLVLLLLGGIASASVGARLFLRA